MSCALRIRLSHFPRLQPLGQRTQIRSRDPHRQVRSRARVKHTLLLEIRFPRPARMTHGVAPGVAKACFTAGFDADTGHETQTVLALSVLVNPLFLCVVTSY